MRRAPKKPGPERDYEVGYERPPVANQFQPGQSGNRKGRPKGSKNLATIFKEAFLAKVTVQEKGRAKVMTKLELAFTNVANAAARGDLRALRLVLDFAARSGNPFDSPDATREALTPDDVEIMKSMLKRYGADPEQVNGGGTASDDPPPPNIGSPDKKD